MHHLTRYILHYRGYTLIYVGMQGSYSGTLTCVKNSFNPIVHLNHSSGRCLGVSMQSYLGTILIYNVYAFNEHKDCIVIWQDLHQQPLFDGVICGDFNVVIDSSDCTTRAATMTCAEKQNWQLVAQMHDLRDAWSMLHTHTAFTFHSQAHRKAWARLDRCYLSRVEWCVLL